MRTCSNTGWSECENDFKENEEKGCDSGNRSGKLSVVGIGPGDLEHLSYKAYKAIVDSEVIVGYKTYLNLIEKLILNQEVISSGMTKEVDRSKLAVDKALAGKKVVIVSSGDAGVYGMAGLILEIITKENLTSQIDVEVVPGITAANAAASTLGSPLMHDYVTISLSDLLTPWEIIEKRVELAAQGDFVIALYNPKSKKRVEQIEQVRKILLKYRSPNIPVGIVTNAKRSNERVEIATIENFTQKEIDMFSLVIIGNSETYSTDQWVITPRGYKL